MDALVASAGWTRDHARRAICTAAGRKGVSRDQRRKPRPRRFPCDTLAVPQKAWRLSGQPSGKYLAAVMDDTLELDLVAHCGHTHKGDRLRTLTGTDLVAGSTMLRTTRNNAYVHVNIHVHGAQEWMRTRTSSNATENGPVATRSATATRPTQR